MRPSAWFVVATTLFLVAGAMWWTNTSRPVVSKKPLPKRVAIKKEGVVTVASSYSWDKVTEEELREFTSLFEVRPVRKNFVLEIDVEPGETILTDAFETRPGEYFLSRLTPTLARSPDGSTVVMMKVESFTVTLTGESKDRISNTKEMVPGGYTTLGCLAHDGNYTVGIAVGLNQGSPPIHVKATGAYRPL